jgi:hypothetical protein
MPDQISRVEKFTKIEELHEIIVPILYASTDQLFKTDVQLTFQGLTHQIQNLIQSYVNMSVVMEARSLSPKNKDNQPILHYHTQHLFDSGYFAKTILGIRKITEPAASQPSKAVYSLPTLLSYLKQYREYLDVEGWQYLVALSSFKDLSASRTESKFTITRLSNHKHIYEHITTYRQKSKPNKETHHVNGVLCFLDDINAVISSISRHSKRAADQIYAHAADTRTWQKKDQLFTARYFTDYANDILTLLQIHHLLFILILDHDAYYTAHPMDYGLAEDFNLSSESVKHVNDHEHQLCNNIRNISVEAEQMLKDLPRFQKFVTSHKL